MIIRLAVTLPVVFVALGLAPTASGLATFTPTRFDDPAPGNCDPSDCSLREAMIAANAAAGTDTIQLAVGTYTLSIPGIEDNSMAGDLDIRDDLTILGPGSALATVNGNGTVTGTRVFHVDPVNDTTSVAASLGGFTITGGGGIAAAGVYSENQARTALTGMVVSGNVAGSAGGGLFNEDEAELSITDSRITDNEGGNAGSAVFNQSSKLTIINSTIAGNRNTFGTVSGAILNQMDGSVTIEGSVVSGNTSGGHGGGFALSFDSTTTIINTTVSGNDSKRNGGGIYAQNDAVVNIVNATVTGNTADSDGTGDGAGGGVFTDLMPPGAVSLRNSLVAGNGDPTSEPDCAGTVTSAGHNLIGIVSAGCTFAPATGDKTGTPAAPVNPLLGPLADNGGPTLTHALLSGSPAIDAAGSGAPPTDQRGLPRVGPPDIGAYELTICQKAVVNRIGTEGNDVLTGTNGADGILGFGGKDRIKGLGGNDGVCAGPGKDRASGAGGKDRLLGEGGKDTLKGGGGKDRLNGGPGRDTCIGQGGKDKAKACEVEKSIP